jgi:serine/threonine protein kinase
MPPEVLSEKDIRSSTQIDVWGIGIIAYQLFYRKLPFRSKIEVNV